MIEWRSFMLVAFLIPHACGDPEPFSSGAG